MEKKMSLKNAGGFPKAFNPHLKRNKALKKNQEEEKRLTKKQNFQSQKRKVFQY